MRLATRILGALTLLLLIGVSSPIYAQDAPSVPAAELDPDVLVKWMQLLYDRVEAEAVSAPGASRLYAYAGVTAYQAVVAGIPDGISTAGQLNSMPDTPYPDEDQEIDWVSSANAALSTVIAGLFPETATDTQRAIKALRDSQARSRESTVGEELVAQSMEYGDSVAEMMLYWVSGDYYAETRDQVYEIPTGDPSFWVPTQSGMKLVEPFWGQLRPFALFAASVCGQKFDLEFSTDPDSTFYKQAVEVKVVGDTLTNEQKDIARFWVDTPGETGTPAGHWVLIENQLIDVLGLKLDKAAMMYALVGSALGDSFISAWSLKYRLNLLRPETYIQEYIDPRWRPFIASPGFPEYPSGHSVVSGAAAEVLTGMFGTVAFTDRSGRRHGFAERSFTSFDAAASEAAISRLYGGIHFRAAIENGLDQGRCIGRNVLDYISLRPQPQGE